LEWEAIVISLAARFDKLIVAANEEIESYLDLIFQTCD
jgi:hypothetical protein